MAKLKHMFKKTAVLFRDREDRNQEKKEPSAPEGLWLKCPKCGEVVYRDDVKAHGYVCPKCEGYFRIGTRTRIRMVADTGTFQEWFTDLETENPSGQIGSVHMTLQNSLALSKVPIPSVCIATI